LQQNLPEGDIEPTVGQSVFATNGSSVIASEAMQSMFAAKEEWISLVELRRTGRRKRSSQ
jgi:hypothetical protein